MAYRLTKEAMEEALKAALQEQLPEELDVHSAFTWTKFLRSGVDGHFNARVENESSLEHEYVKPSSVWVQTSNAGPDFEGRLSISSDNRQVGIYSKRAFKYPILTVRALLPSIAGLPVSSNLGFGFENDYGVGPGLAAFRYLTPAGGGEELQAVLEGPWAVAQERCDITALMPADYKTARHVYTIELTRPMAVFWIDNSVVAYGLITPNGSFTSIAGPPYALFSIETAISPFNIAFLQITTFGTEFNVQIAPYDFRVQDGDPRPPRVIRLYEAGTDDLLAGLAVDPDVTSHPFPLFGYEGKTINFMSDEAGNMDIEVLKQTGNWRVHSTVAIAANTLVTTTITDEEVLGRIVFTPTLPPANILEAEVVLR